MQLIVGGWGGGVVGMSSLNGKDAARNETTQYVSSKKAAGITSASA